MVDPSVPPIGFGAQVIIIIITAASTLIVGIILFALKRYISARDECFKAMQEAMKQLDNRTKRQSKAQVLNAKLQDDQTNRLHPGENSDIAEKIMEELKDEKGDY